MNNKANAKEQFNKFLDEFPDSEYAIIAREHLKQISLE